MVNILETHDTEVDGIKVQFLATDFEGGTIAWKMMKNGQRYGKYYRASDTRLDPGIRGFLEDEAARVIRGITK